MVYCLRCAADTEPIPPLSATAVMQLLLVACRLWGSLLVLDSLAPAPCLSPVLVAPSAVQLLQVAVGAEGQAGGASGAGGAVHGQVHDRMAWGEETVPGEAALQLVVAMVQGSAAGSVQQQVCTWLAEQVASHLGLQMHQPGLAAGSSPAFSELPPAWELNSAWEQLLHACASVTRGQPAVAQALMQLGLNALVLQLAARPPTTPQHAIKVCMGVKPDFCSLRYKRRS